ncbi:MAG TPA: GNAT family N-acetyltransferase [Myxococcaceae bacterium]|nr:GNAT family N-acetyltransferase [Myxococcaceae bacterium]
MAKLNLGAFERQIRVRQVRLEDWEAFRALQERCFPGMEPTTREQFTSQITRFAEGQLCVEYQGRLVASSSSLILDFELYKDWSSWDEIADGGYIRNHKPTGTTLYGIEMMVDPDYRGRGLARRLYDARKKLARELNLMRIVVGGRIPGYRKHAGAMTPREYVEKVVARELSDPALTVQLSNGFVVKRIIPAYIADPQSGGFAAFLEWTNLDYVPAQNTRFVPAAPVRVCAVQYQLRRLGSFEEFAERVEHFVSVASDYRCDFILFPEIFTAELLSLVRTADPAVAMRALDEFTPRFLELCTGLAVKHDINVVGGTHLTVEDGKLFNIAYLFRRDGTIAKQYKLHVTSTERSDWGVTSGNRLEVFDTDRGRISIQICYDVEFPELTRLAVEAGAQLVFVPFCTDERYAYLRVRYCAQARCIENQIYVVTAGLVGSLPGISALGLQYAQSGMFTPSDIPFVRDAVAAEATPNVEMVIFEDLDLELLRRQRQSGSVLNWNDRRTDLYRLTYTPPPEPAETEPLGHRLSDLLSEEHVSLALSSTDRASVLREMAEVTFGRGTEAADRATKLLAAREKISTTAVGHGVGIPHCRSPDVQQVRLAIGFSAAGIDFQASDGAPVRIVVSVVSPTDAASHHLGVLARLASLLRSEDTRRELLAMQDPREVVALLRREDERFERELAERRAGPGRTRPPRTGPAGSEHRETPLRH